MKYLLLSFFLLLFFSCKKEQLSVAECEEISKKAFQGHPTSAHQLKEQCQGKTLKYTKEKCQLALKDLVMTSSLRRTLEIHGEGAEGCFTENDLKNFNRE